MNVFPTTVYAEGDWDKFISDAEYSITEIEGVIPLFEIVTNPVIHISEVKARRFYLTDMAQLKAKEEIEDVH